MMADWSYGSKSYVLVYLMEYSTSLTPYYLPFCSTIHLSGGTIAILKNGDVIEVQAETVFEEPVTQVQHRRMQISQATPIIGMHLNI